MQASKILYLTNIIFDLVAPPYPVAYPSIPPIPTLISTYLRHGRLDDHTSAYVQIGVGQGWVDTLDPHMQPLFLLIFLS